MGRFDINQAQQAAASAQAELLLCIFLGLMNTCGNRNGLGMGMGRPPTERRPNRESRAEAQYSPQARMGQHGFLFVGECH